MAVSLILLAAVIAVVNGRPELRAGAEERGSLETIKITTHCRTTFEVVYPSAEGELPYPQCWSECPRGEEGLWIDGVVFKRLSELKEYDLMVEMTYMNGSLQGCKMVPYETAQESADRQEAHTRRLEWCFANDKESQVETVVPSVTERIPASIHVRLEGFTQVGDSFYMVSPTVMTWHDAVKYCDRLGASLALIESSAEQHHLRGVLSTHVWIGLNDIVTEGIFVNAGNTPMSYSKWKWNQPDNFADNEDCLMLADDSNYDWNDFPCTKQIRALCEHPLEEDLQKYMCPEGYMQFKSSCYIVSKHAGTYSHGELYCSSVYGYPVFINSEQEQDFLAGKKTEDVYIGITDREEEGTFISTSFGVPLFNRWVSDQPDNYHGIEDCVELTTEHNYRWNDVPCDITRRVLCEIHAEVVDERTAQHNQHQNGTAASFETSQSYRREKEATLFNNFFSVSNVYTTAYENIQKYFVGVKHP